MVANFDTCSFLMSLDSGLCKGGDSQYCLKAVEYPTHRWKAPGIFRINE